MGKKSEEKKELEKRSRGVRADSEKKKTLKGEKDIRKRLHRKSNSALLTKSSGDGKVSEWSLQKAAAKGVT